MKKLLLVFLFGPMILSLKAQSLYPDPVPTPLTGLSYLKQRYPYILDQMHDSANGSWNNLNLDIFTMGPLGYKSLIQQKGWENNDWKVYYEMKDSFVVDNAEQRFTTAIEEIKYNYPGFNYQAKNKYTFTYDNADRLSYIDIKTANPPSSTNYQNNYTMTLIYDANGKRISDTLTYVQAKAPYVSKYVYDGSGHIIANYMLDLDPAAAEDTSNIMFYSYSGDQVKTTYSRYFDSDAGEYLTQGADTFEYDSKGNVTKHISYYLVSINGGAYELQPWQNESYSYNSDNLLTEIITSDWLTDQWRLNSKTTLMYDGDMKPTIAFIYTYNGTSWNSNPSERLLFNEFTSLENVNAKSIKISFYPNPTTDKLIAESEVSINNITICDISGKKVLINQYTEGNKKAIADVSTLKKGVYFITYQTPAGEGSMKFVKD